MMAGEIHPLAPHNLPPFITPPGESDGLMILMAVMLVLGVLGAGVFYLTLHTLPERMAHRRHRAQFELIAVLGLLALVTHQNLFWVGPARRAVAALERIAGYRDGEDAPAAPPAGRAEP